MDKKIPTVEKQTIIEKHPDGLNGCLYLFILCCFAVFAYNGAKWSKVKLTEEQIKLEQLKKDGTVVDTVKSIRPDTLKIDNNKKLCKQVGQCFQKQR